MAEHAQVFRGLAKALQAVGMVLVAVGAVLALLGFGGAFMAAGFLLWGAGDALDSTVDWAEGKITGKQLAFRAGTAILLSVAGGAAAKAGVMALERFGPRLGRWFSDPRAWASRRSRPGTTPTDLQRSAAGRCRGRRGCPGTTMSDRMGGSSRSAGLGRREHRPSATRSKPR